MSKPPLTWGNVSAISATRDLVAIKPSGVPYERLRTDDIVVVDLRGRVVGVVGVVVTAGVVIGLAGYWGLLGRFTG